jgi:hypothetical protein
MHDTTASKIISYMIQNEQFMTRVHEEAKLG